MYIFYNTEHWTWEFWLIPSVGTLFFLFSQLSSTRAIIHEDSESEYEAVKVNIQGCSSGL